MSTTNSRGISIGIRLISIIVVVVTLILVGFGAFQYSKAKLVYTQLVDEGLESSCTRLSKNLGSPLWNFSQEQAAEVLSAEISQDAIVAITVRMGTDSKPFSSVVKGPDGKVRAVADELGLPRTLLRRAFQVPWEGKTIATGTVYYSLASLERTLNAQVISMVLQTLTTDVVLIVLIGLILSSVVIRPLGVLTGIANKLASGDFAGNVVNDAVASLREVAKKLHRDELGALTNTFHHMLENLRARDLELDNHRKNLERLVAERTAALTKRNDEMRLVLDNVDQGLVLVSPDGTMSEERSAAFARFFGNSETEVDRCLFEDPKARAFFRLGFEQIADGFMPLVVALEQLPTKVQRGNSVFGMRYKPLMSAEACAGVLFMISDITSELAAQKKVREQYEQIKIFERCMRDRIGFVQFFHETRALVELVRDERFGSADERLRAVHTLKGNASIFDVLSVADVAHALESALVDAETDTVMTHRVALLEAWDAFAQRVASLIGDDLSDRFELSRCELDDIIRAVKQGRPTAEVVRQLASITYEPLKLRFARIEQQLRGLAARLQKAPVQCTIRVESLRLPPDQFAGFWAAFSHVLRNAADHGFECPEEREARGKPAQNRVVLAATADEQGITLVFSDDGHGVDWNRVETKAKRLELPHATRADLVEALFSPGFSTADQVSAMSGRGVGLSAVTVEVSKLHGTVSLESELGQGTRLTFRFPNLSHSDPRPSVIPPISIAPVSG